VRFHVLTAVSTKVTAFWDIATFSFVKVGRRFGGAYCLYHQGDKQAARENKKLTKQRGPAQVQDVVPC
jgi:hypothetical protein